LSKTLLLLSLLILTTGAANAESGELPCGETTCLWHEVNLEKEELSLVSAEQQGRRFVGLDYARNWAGDRTVLFATNSGIFDIFFRPLGLHIEEGKLLTELNTKVDRSGNFFLQPNGVFFVSGNSAKIVTTSQFKSDPSIRIATQSGPALLLDGVIPSIFAVESANKLRRNGVGIGKNGNVVFAVSDGNISFYDFALFFKEQLNCSDALFLDGIISGAYSPSRPYPKLPRYAALLIVTEKLSE